MKIKIKENDVLHALLNSVLKSDCTEPQERYRNICSCPISHSLSKKFNKEIMTSCGCADLGGGEFYASEGIKEFVKSFDDCLDDVPLDVFDYEGWDFSLWPEDYKKMFRDHFEKFIDKEVDLGELKRYKVQEDRSLSICSRCGEEFHVPGHKENGYSVYEYSTTIDNWRCEDCCGDEDWSSSRE